MAPRTGSQPLRLLEWLPRNLATGHKDDIAVGASTWI